MAADRRRRPLPFNRSEAIRLPEDHGWRVTPHHRICVLDKGDLRFEYPDTWSATFEGNSLKFHDRPYPNDDMVLEVSVVRTPPLDWSQVPPLSRLLLENLKGQGQFLSLDQVYTFAEPGLEIAWAEYSRVEEDPATKLPREAVWRQAHCHPGQFYRGNYLPVGVLTFGSWIEHRHRADPIWEHILQTIVMGEPIADPRRGPRYN